MTPPAQNPSDTMSLPGRKLATGGGFVFISFDSADREAARRVVHALQKKDFEVWFDEQRVECGDDIQKLLKDQVNRCAAFVPLISRTLARRPKESDARHEWSWALDRLPGFAPTRKFILPIVIDDLDFSRSSLIPGDLRRIRAQHFHGGEIPPESTWFELLRREVDADRRREAPLIAPDFPVDTEMLAMERAGDSTRVNFLLRWALCRRGGHVVLERMSTDELRSILVSFERALSSRAKVQEAMLPRQWWVPHQIPSQSSRPPMPLLRELAAASLASTAEVDGLLGGQGVLGLIIDDAALPAEAAAAARRLDDLQRSLQPWQPLLLLTRTSPDNRRGARLACLDGGLSGLPGERLSRAHLPSARVPQSTSAPEGAGIQLHPSPKLVDWSLEEVRGNPEVRCVFIAGLARSGKRDLQRAALRATRAEPELVEAWLEGIPAKQRELLDSGGLLADRTLEWMPLDALVCAAVRRSRVGDPLIGSATLRRWLRLLPAAVQKVAVAALKGSPGDPTLWDGCLSARAMAVLGACAPAADFPLDEVSASYFELPEFWAFVESLPTSPALLGRLAALAPDARAVLGFCSDGEWRDLAAAGRLGARLTTLRRQLPIT